MIADSVKKYRKKLGLSQDGLARKADIPYSSLLKIENGNDPRVSSLIKIADALNVSLDDLAGRKSKEK